MGIQIDDGKGNSGPAEVKNNKLRTWAITEQKQQHANEDEGNSFSIVIDSTTSGASNQFFYLKNTGELLLHITSMKGFVDVDTEVGFLLDVSGTPTSPSDITPVNRNTKSAQPISGTIQEGADLQLTGGNQVDRFEMNSANTGLFKIDWGSTIVIGKNGTMALQSMVTGTINLTISCYLHT